MTELKFTPHERVWLKTHPRFSEKWLQDRINDDPTIPRSVVLAILTYDQPSISELEASHAASIARFA